MEKMVVTRAERVALVTGGSFQKFVRVAGRGLPRPARRLLREMLWGITLSGSLRLSSIGQWLEDKATRLLYRVKRLSRGLANPRGWKEAETVRQHLAQMAGLISAETSLILDSSDIRKDYGHKFQYLDTVRDGDRDETVHGYSFLSVTAVFAQGRQLPLYTAPYSAQAPDYDSENDEVLKALEAVTAAVGTKGVWVADKGFDNRWLFNEMAARHLHFLIAGRHEKRTVLSGAGDGAGGEALAAVIARAALPFQTRFKRRRPGPGGRALSLLVRYGAQAVELPEAYDSVHKRRSTLKLWVIVVEGFRSEAGGRSFFLTNIPVTNDHPKELEAVWRRYRDRWAVEEMHEFLKGSFHLEDFRVRSWQAIRRILVCSMLAFAFLCRFLEHLELRHKRLALILAPSLSELGKRADFLYGRLRASLQLSYSLADALELRQSHG
jgi:hypothetical protein